MNKQEFQKTIRNMEPPKHFSALTFKEAFNEGFNSAKNNALFNSCFLNEPEKPVVPQYVADWYVDHEAGFELHLSYLCINAQRYPERVDRKVLNWYNNLENEPIQTLVKMKLYGYTIKKEKLYTVEIPNPNGDGNTKTYLGENGDGKVELFTWYCYGAIETADNWKQLEYAQLTEDKIKEDYEWAWKFKEEVGE